MGKRHRKRYNPEDLELKTKEEVVEEKVENEDFVGEKINRWFAAMKENGDMINFQRTQKSNYRTK